MVRLTDLLRESQNYYYDADTAIYTHETRQICVLMSGHYPPPSPGNEHSAVMATELLQSLDLAVAVELSFGPAAQSEHHRNGL